MEEKELQNSNVSEENQKLKESIKQLRNDNNSFIYGALGRAQAEMPIVDKDCVSFARQKFASLANIIKQAKPVLAKHGLSVVQLFDSLDGKNYLITRLCHSSGQYIESRYLLPVPQIEEKNGILDRLREDGKAIT